MKFHLGTRILALPVAVLLAAALGSAQTPAPGAAKATATAGTGKIRRSADGI